MKPNSVGCRFDDGIDKLSAAIASKWNSIVLELETVQAR
jgi:hypothetical protein